MTGPYTEEEFWEDLKRMTGGQIDEELARHMIRESGDILDGIVEQGVPWQPSLGVTVTGQRAVRPLYPRSCRTLRHSSGRYRRDN